jgi:hypothetical protein
LFDTNGDENTGILPHNFTEWVVDDHIRSVIIVKSSVARIPCRQELGVWLPYPLLNKEYIDF